MSNDEYFFSIKKLPVNDLEKKLYQEPKKSEIKATYVLNI
jgi:hypothetical protein